MSWSDEKRTNWVDVLRDVLAALLRQREVSITVRRGGADTLVVRIAL